MASPLSQSTKREQAGAKTPKRPKMDDRPPKTLPLRYELCPVEDMVELIAHMLGELIATNDAIRISSGGLTRFHSRYGPQSPCRAASRSSVHAGAAGRC